MRGQAFDFQYVPPFFLTAIPIAFIIERSSEDYHSPSRSLRYETARLETLLPDQLEILICTSSTTENYRSFLSSMRNL